MLERLKRRLELVGNDRDELLGDLLEEAEQYILGSVSYTHLDVYKRQMPWRA